LAAVAGCVGELANPTDYPPPVSAKLERPDAGGAPQGGSGCDVTAIFAGCVACHDERGSFGGFDMKSAGWEARLVGGAPTGASSASECTGGDRVYLVAGSAPASGLFLDKLRPDTATSCGDQMPLLAPPLDASAMACVQQWANALTAR
jgi:hypothetical protein